MNDADNKIACDTHGASNAAFLCKHLVEGEKQGFNLGYDPERPDDLCPDAWCDKCEAVFEQAGEWNEKAEKFADIKLICSKCYEDMRERNWLQNDEILLARPSYSLAKQTIF